MLGTDVLRLYLEVTREDSSTEAARQKFALRETSLGAATNAVPYARDELVRAGFDFDNLQALARHRRSVRWFVPKPVPRDLVERAMLIAREAPSACNRQPFVFRAFDDPQRAREIAEISMGTVGYCHQIPILIVVIGQMRSFFDPHDRHLVYIDGALVGLTFVLGLETLELSSCIFNWPYLSECEYATRNAVNPENDERPVFLSAVDFTDPGTRRAIRQAGDPRPVAIQMNIVIPGVGPRN